LFKPFLSCLFSEIASFLFFAHGRLTSPSDHFSKFVSMLSSLDGIDATPKGLRYLS
jgi:hypothetical protein